MQTVLNDQSPYRSQREVRHRNVGGLNTTRIRSAFPDFQAFLLVNRADVRGHCHRIIPRKMERLDQLPQP